MVDTWKQRHPQHYIPTKTQTMSTIDWMMDR